VRIVEIMNGHSVVNVTVRDGKIRLVRRMLTTLRHKVLTVRRVRIGEIRLGDLPVGARRELSGPEIASIRELHATLTWKSSKAGR
jgi:23S rRNA pseudouridine2605 synthase